MRVGSLNGFASNQLGPRKQTALVHVAFGETAILGSSPAVVTSANFKAMQWRQRPPATHNSQPIGRPLFLLWTLELEWPMHEQVVHRSTPHADSP